MDTKNKLTIRIRPFMKLRTIAGLVPALLISQTLLAQGPATPPGLQSPPPGRLQERIATLPPAARARALDWLARFDFPVEDIETIDIDVEGGVLYADPRPDLADPVADESGTSPSGLPESDVFALHSKPGAANVVFVDVDGHTITGTAWNAGGAESAFPAPGGCRLVDERLHALLEEALENPGRAEETGKIRNRDIAGRRPVERITPRHDRRAERC